MFVTEVSDSILQQFVEFLMSLTIQGVSLIVHGVWWVGFYCKGSGVVCQPLSEVEEGPCLRNDGGPLEVVSHVLKVTQGSLTGFKVVEWWVDLTG